MSEELFLFEQIESYSVNNLRQECEEYIRKKYPRPIKDEDLWEYQQFLRSEINLEFAHRLRIIADDIERKEYGK